MLTIQQGCRRLGKPLLPRSALVGAAEKRTTKQDLTRCQPLAARCPLHIPPTFVLIDPCFRIPSQLLVACLAGALLRCCSQLLLIPPSSEQWHSSLACGEIQCASDYVFLSFCLTVSVKLPESPLVVAAPKSGSAPFLSLSSALPQHFSVLRESEGAESSASPTSATVEQTEQ